MSENLSRMNLAQLVEFISNRGETKPSTDGGDYTSPGAMEKKQPSSEELILEAKELAKLFPDAKEFGVQGRTVIREGDSWSVLFSPPHYHRD